MGPKKPRQTRRKRPQEEAAELEELERCIAEGVPAAGQSLQKFSELPISQYTKEGLKEAKFTDLTAIQRYALPHVLGGRDVLGAAKTGSGKTLAFLIPVIEKLYRLKWGSLDGLGALVILPTRELALQVFNELRKVGKHHDFSAGLLVGGRNVKEEQQLVGGMNILICTPGRLLQHMDETPSFDASNLQILVLDEADRILDMGFSAAVNAIVQNLPMERQTLLFSATQTKSVKQLARLSLDNPEYVSVHENAEAPTPAKLEQAYAIVELQDKLSVLWSFIRTHLKSKILVFASTCKQVKFLYEAFSRLRPGCPLRCLHGGMKHLKRMAVFYDFSEATSGMVLLATDLAARGLDFAKLDWVFQMDCPEDVEAYIHRVGRTARYVSAGKGVLLLTPSERAFLEQLEAARVPVKSIKINPSKTQPLTPALQALLSKHLDMKESAQRCVTAYLRSVFLAPNRAVFDINKLPIAEYALSMGLSAAPKLKFVNRAGRATQEVNIGGPALKDSLPEQPSSSGRMADDSASEEPADELLTVKQPDGQGSGHQADAALLAAAAVAPTARKRKKLKIKLDAPASNRVVFDEAGTSQAPLAALADGTNPDNDDGESLGHATAEERFKAAAAALKARDAADKRDYQERRKHKQAEAKAKRKAREAGEQGDQPMATLGSGLGYPGEETTAGAEQESGSERETNVDHSDVQWDSEDETAEPPLQSKRKRHSSEPGTAAAAKKPRAEKSHLGMGLKQDVAALSLSEQEQLALRLLAAK